MQARSEKNVWRSIFKVANDHLVAGEINTAITLLQRAAKQWPNDTTIRSKLLQVLLTDKKFAEAAEYASSWKHWPVMDDRLVALSAKALVRGDERKCLLELFEKFKEVLIVDASIVAKLMDFHHADPHKAIELGNDFIAQSDTDVNAIHLRLASAYSMLRKYDESNEHLLISIANGTDPLNSRAALGRNLLKQGTPKTACSHLEAALQQKPDLHRLRVDCARAYKLSGDPAYAVKLLDDLPSEVLEKNPSYLRLKISCLIQSGAQNRAQEAFALYREGKANNLSLALKDDLFVENATNLHLPEERMRWAANIIGAPNLVENAQWISDAQWGYAADRILLNWLECRPDLSEQAMHLLGNLSLAESKLQKLSLGKPVIFVSAHVGVLYAGPVAFELLGLDCVWLASSPNVPGVHYEDALISTADLSESKVARQVVQKIREGRNLAIVVDGATNPAAPSVEFEGRQVTYSNFASRLSRALKIACVYASPIWNNDNKIDFYIGSMPIPNNEVGESEFSEQWKDCYFSHVRNVIKSGPKNLRLSGGIWRNVS